jgi:hypothetical protein
MAEPLVFIDRSMNQCHVMLSMTAHAESFEVVWTVIFVIAILVMNTQSSG